MLTFFYYLCAFLLGGMTVLVLALVYAIVNEDDEKPQRDEARVESKIDIHSSVPPQNSEAEINLTYH